MTFTFHHQYTRYTVPLGSAYDAGNGCVQVFVYADGTYDGRHVARLWCDPRSGDAIVTEGELPNDVTRAIVGWIRGGSSIEMMNEQPRPRARRGADPVIVPRAVREYVAGERGGRDG